MKLELPNSYQAQAEVLAALLHNLPVVALESTVITHGLPRPQNLALAREMEEIVRENGATPATIALLNGVIKIGLQEKELENLAFDDTAMKVSLRNLGICVARRQNGGTTVAATMLAARRAGIFVFSTGGIGGVHRENPQDVSADLNALSENPIVVVCAGAKAILDLPATLEALETRGVPLLGYQTDTFPAFYSRSSGLPVDARVDTAQEIYRIAKAHWETGNRSAILVCNPVPEELAIDPGVIEPVIIKAVEQAKEHGIHGAGLTPFLLEEVNRATNGKSLQANLALLRNNACLGVEVARCFSSGDQIAF